MAAPNYNELGTAFVQHYYQKFDTSRQEVIHLYGQQSIYEKLAVDGLQALPQMQHEVTTMDAISGGVPGSVLICVTGRFIMDNEVSKPMFFTQVFMLMPLPNNGGYYVQNDIFRRVSLS